MRYWRTTPTGQESERRKNRRRYWLDKARHEAVCGALESGASVDDAQAAARDAVLSSERLALVNGPLQPRRERTPEEVKQFDLDVAELRLLVGVADARRVAGQRLRNRRAWQKAKLRKQEVADGTSPV
jgi:hypothetical protein